MAVAGELPAHLEPDPAVAAGDERDAHAASASGSTRALGGLRQRGGRDREHRVRVPGRGPHRLEAQQVLVHHRAHPVRVPDGRDAADRVPGHLAHVPGVGTLDRLVDRGLDQRHVRPVVTRHEREHGRLAWSPRASRATSRSPRARTRPPRRPPARCGWSRRAGGSRRAVRARAARFEPVARCGEGFQPHSRPRPYPHAAMWTVADESPDVPDVTR